MTDKITEFHEYLKQIKGLSDRTIYHYFTYHRHFRNMELTQENINKFVISKGNNSVCRGYLKAYLEFLKKSREFELPVVKSGSKKRKLIRPITKIEINKLRDYAYLTKKRDGIIIDLLYYGALRRAEIQTIKVNSFNWAEWFRDPEQFCEFKVIGKRNKERKVLVHPKAIKTLLGIYYEKGILTSFMSPKEVLQKLSLMDDMLFKNMSEWKVWKIVKKYSTKYLKRDIRPHEIRHARATELELNGASIRDIQRYLGHTNLVTTEIYLHSDENKSLENIKVISGLHIN